MQRVNRITDWRGLRLALGLNQSQMAKLLGLHRSHIFRIEERGCCPHQTVEILMRLWLQTPSFRTRLGHVKYPHPFPEDLLPEDVA